MTPSGVVRDVVSGAPVGQVPVIEFGQQGEAGGVEEPVDRFERVEEAEARVVVQGPCSASEIAAEGRATARKGPADVLTARGHDVARRPNIEASPMSSDPTT